MKAIQLYQGHIHTLELQSPNVESVLYLLSGFLNWNQGISNQIPLACNDYITEAEESLKRLKLNLEEENRFETISEEFNLIQEKIDRNKKNDIERNRKEISVFLASEIVSRYFYQKGRIIERLKDDKDIFEAIRLFDNIEDYNNLLNVH